jgi:hypothetical protein
MMGSTIAAALSASVASGVIDITAAAPIAAGERDRFYREGKRPFSVKIPKVGWVEYKQIPLLDTTFTLVASAVDGIRRGEDVTGIASQAGVNIATNLLDKSYMSGIGDLFDAIQDPERYAESYVTRMVSGFVPFSGATRQTTQIMDSTVRDPEGFVEQIKSQTPFLAEGVMPRLTAFGEKADRTIPSPLAISPSRQSQVDAELERVGEEVNFVGTTIAGMKLNREEKYVYQAVAGQATYKVLDALIAAPAYQAMTIQQQAEALDKAINKARESTRKKLEPVFRQRRGEEVAVP